jgi:alginate O-acetyltransferase complex protein AlgJ
MMSLTQKARIAFFTVSVLGLAGVALVAGNVTTPRAVMDELAAKATSGNDGGMVVKGKDGWLFASGELRSLSVGPFWGEAAASVSKAADPAGKDPLPAILDFKAQLDKAGVELLVVPVPAKATIYPEKILDSVPASSDAFPRLDAAQQEFFRILGENGIAVLDLASAFLEHRNDKGGALYCMQDTHWSGRACVLAAGLIAERIKDREWLAALPKRTFDIEEKTVEIVGDLAQMSGEAKPVPEKMPLTFVYERTDAGAAPVAPSDKSPILLLGDSHNLIFHGGDDMLARSAGLPDQLAYALGTPVDLVGVRGSGATPARINLARRRDNLAGKKLVIWCFTVREFTESPQGWRKVPVVR